MQKLIGSILIIFACSAIGFEKSYEMQLHLKELETLKNVFVLLKKEIQYTRVPLAELFLKISKKMEGGCSCWLEELSQKLYGCEQGTFQDVWGDSLKKFFRESKLTKTEKEELHQLGKSIGYIEGVDLYLDQLEISIQRTREELKNKKKMYQSIGILGGIFLVIVLF